jgi:hypothetical protein
MATSQKPKHTRDIRRSNKPPDLESVLEKQELIAFVVLLILAALVTLVIGL